MPHIVSGGNFAPRTKYQYSRLPQLTSLLFFKPSPMNIISNTGHSTVTGQHFHSYTLHSTDLGADPTMRRFSKGMSRLRPSQPKYGNTWDPQQILNYIENLPTPLSLPVLSQKLVTLLALITGGRLQTISVIKLGNIIQNQDDIQISITERIKTSGLNREQPTLHIPFFKQRPALCVASTLKEYLKTTAPLRNSQEKFLFLTTRKPHSVANKQTISRWVREILASAGIDTSTFKPHSIRHASSSAALKQGISLEVICRTAGWSERTETFAKFYNRPLSKKTDYAKAI